MSLRSRGWVAGVVLNVLIDRGGCCRQCCFYVAAIGDCFESPSELIGNRGICGSLRSGNCESAFEDLCYQIQWPDGPVERGPARHRLDSGSRFTSVSPSPLLVG